MTTALIAALRESRGYLVDQGWHQSAQLMTLAAQEIERLNARVRQLEEGCRPGPDRSRSARSSASPPL
jgi:hypothetical protein